MKISAIKEFADGMNLDEVKGTISRAGKRTESDHPEYGKSSFQPITIKDESGEIGATLNKQSEVKTGDIIFILAHKSEKHGLTGITVETYKGAKQLKITGSAVIHIGNTPKSEEKPLNQQPDSKNEVKNVPVKEELPNWDNINLRKDRNICLAYAKDLAVVGKIGVEDICNRAELFVKYVYGGLNVNLTPEQKEQIETDSKDEDIPFFTEAFGEEK